MTLVGKRFTNIVVIYLVVTFARSLSISIMKPKIAVCMFQNLVAGGKIQRK